MGMKKISSRLVQALQHEKYQKRLYVIPFVFTFANAFLGFIAIVQALEGNYSYAVYSIMAAALMDLCDGRIARALGISSLLGIELDSLSDAISFCVAPCVVMYSWYPGYVGWTGLIALGFYLSAGLYRLAKFNITAASQQDCFHGLPTPVAAFFVASLVLYHEWILHHRVWFMLYKRVPFIIMIALALLMISSIPFPTLKRYRVHLRWYYMPALFLGWAVLLGLFMRGYPLLLMIVAGYIASGMIHWLVQRHKGV
jgi:CDP-diacylglycerol--serine O-phosphatidyltransferase